MTTSYLNILLGFIFIISCNSNRGKTKQIEYTPYFTYTQAEHYHLDIDDYKVSKMITKDTHTLTEMKFLALVTGGRPEKISDPGWVNDLKQFGFVKKNIPSNKLGYLKKTFCDRPRQDGITTACIPTYRDIVVFKNKTHIVGVAKICFGCRITSIVGSSHKTSGFGDENDYKWMSAALYN